MTFQTKFLVLTVVLSLLTGRSVTERYFFLGSPPKISKGVLEIEGYYAETEHSPVVLSDVISDNDNSTDLELEEYPDSESRKLIRKGHKEADDSLLISAMNDQITKLYPFRIADTASKTIVAPPLCVACTCLQGAQTCAAAGGVYLTTLSVTAAVTSITALTAVNALSCTTISITGFPAIAGASPLSCLVPPPPTLSVCDPNCRTYNALVAPNCALNPSNVNCPQFPPPAICSTDCQNLQVGSTVRCNPAYPTVISPRPTAACNNIWKRDTSHSEPPAIESSIDTELPQSRKSRLLGLQIFRTTTTSTNTIKGTVTATYVGNGNCLPMNILSSPNC